LYFGTDRTGMVAYCIEALLGVSETDIVRDYLYSNFGKIGGSRSISTIRSRYPKLIKDYDGKTLQEKTYRFLNEYVGGLVAKSGGAKCAEHDFLLRRENPVYTDRQDVL